jgi:autotransporter-associated beta strand protein
MQIARNYRSSMRTNASILAAVVATAMSAQAASLTWNNGASNMSWNTTDANWSGSIWNNATPDAAVFGAAGIGAVYVTEPITAQSVTINDAGYTLADGSGTLRVNEAITNHADLSLSAILVGTLTKEGLGNLSIDQQETYTGATVINGGTLTLAGVGGLYYSGGGPIRINSGGTLSMSGTIGYACPAIYNIGPGAGSVILNGGTWQHTGPSNGKGTQPKSGRNFTIGALGATLDSGTAGEEFTLGYRYDYDAPGVIGATAGGTLTLSGDGDGDLNYQLRGSGGLIKTGAGTWKLSNVNTYSGNTVVMAGTLALANGVDLLVGTGQGHGSITSPSITLSNGATFDVSLATGGFTLGGSQSLLGYGTVAGAVNTSSGSKIYAGLDGTYGTNSFSNNLSLASGALCYFDLGTAATGPNDRMVVGGDLVLSSPVFHLKSPSALVNLDAGMDYVLINVTGTISGSPTATPVWDVAPINAANFRVLVAGNKVVLRIVTATPPSAIGSAGPPTVNHFDNVTVSVTVTPGSSPISTVSLNAVAIGVGASVPLVAAGGNVYTNTVTVGAVAALGTNTVSATVTDTSSLSAVANIPVVVVGANRVWNGAGADDNWSSNPNWLGGKGPGVGDTATFAGATRLTPSMDSSYSLTGLAFYSTADSFVLGNVASTLTLTGSGVVNNSTNLQTLDMPIVLAGSPTFNAAAGDVVLGQKVTGSGSLIKAGNGNLTFSSGQSEYTGVTIINGGTLTIGNGVRLYNTGGGPVTINSGATLSLPGGMDVSWGGCLGYLPPYANNMLIDGGTLRHTGTSNRQVDAGAGRGFTIGALGATLDSATAGETFSIGFWAGITIVSSAGGTLTLTGEGDGVIDFPVPGSGGVTKTGSGTWTLSNSNNTYTGTTKVAEGALAISYPTLVSTSTIIIKSNAVLSLNFSEPNTVGALVFGTIPMAPGVYDASTVPAQISGSGSLVVTGYPHPSITSSVSGNTMTLSWPEDYAGWSLQAQTNTLATGLSTNWHTILGSSALTSTNLPISAANPSVFYRLSY